MSSERNIPLFFKQTFRRWFFRRHPGESRGPEHGLGSGLRRNDGNNNTVLLWPDTYTNYFQPQIGQAAVQVLEHWGFQVLVPDTQLCCGRPLYDFGFLDQAKRQLQDILSLLKPQLEAGLPLIVLEPSCAAVFRDELVNLFPDDPLAQKLKAQTFLLSEFLLNASSPLVGEETGGGTTSGLFPPIPAFPHKGGRSIKAILQTHCHQKSVLSASADREVLEKLGIDIQEPESGCCGMAGAFGFEADHYDLSMQIGEKALLPTIRQAPDDTLLVANGFSCREQITQATGRKALHLVEVLKAALKL